MVTVGGAFSNHLIATAAFCAAHGVPSVGLIKYHKIDPDNPTMQHCQKYGMKLIPIGRSTSFADYLVESDYFIAEGAADAQGILGMRALMEEIESQISPDVVLVSAGLGGTVCGLSTHASSRTRVIACSTFEKHSIQGWVSEQDSWGQIEWASVKMRYGGFGSYNDDVIDFTLNFYNEFGILLDPIYTSKTFAWLFSQIQEGHFDTGTKIAVIHTGGLQGWEGYRWRYSESNKSRK